VPADLRDILQTTLGSGYSVERELGGGGMSRVFVARDRALDRSIVVKILPAEAAADVPIERFKREIALAARLQHPHIVPLLSAGDLRGLPYYTMPYVEGESLRARLLRGERLSISECVSILKDLARALAYAHERGVVHRDIKPENILLTGGSAVVTDFGIAKAIVSARTEIGEPSAERTLTQVGASMGTPAYMSPEQISGDPSTDHRTDIYAFGCVAYELLAGAPPFSGPPHRLFSAHLGDTPRPILEMRPDCPPLLAELVMRCLEKDPSRRPQSAAELLQSLDVTSTPAARTVQWSPPKSRRSRVVIATLVALALVVVGYLLFRARSDVGVEKRLAVIPFANVGGDSAQQYFADGVSDELTTALGRVPGVQVASRNLAYRYRGQRDVDARSVGRALDVGYVVQGSVRRAGGRLHISAQLTSAKDGGEIWADEIERAAGDVFSAQNDITASIIGNLRPHLASGAKAVASATALQGTSNPEAYDLYLRGRFLLERRGPGVPLAAENFELAIAKDPRFARAYAGLSLALELMPYFGGLSAAEVRPRAWNAARHALSIDPSLAEAHAALGMLYQHEYNWKLALEELRRAVDYSPDDASARLQYGRTLLYTGDYYGAKSQFQQARQSDPYSAVASRWLADAYAMGGQRDSALAEGRRSLQIDSTGLMAAGVALTFTDLGLKEEARALVRPMPNTSVFATYKGNVLARAGDRSGAMKLLRDFESRHPRPWLGELAIAMISLGLGDTARAISALERSTDAGEIWPAFHALSEPAFDGIRGSPRFAALVRRVGLDEKIFTAPNGGRPH
jgi:TolB-like protein